MDEGIFTVAKLVSTSSLQCNLTNIAFRVLLDTALALHIMSILYVTSQTVFWGNDVDANGESPVFYEGELEGFGFIRFVGA